MRNDNTDAAAKKISVAAMKKKGLRDDISVLVVDLLPAAGELLKLPSQSRCHVACLPQELPHPSIFLQLCPLLCDLADCASWLLLAVG